MLSATSETFLSNRNIMVNAVCSYCGRGANVKKMNTDRDERHAAELANKDTEIAYLKRQLEYYAGVEL